jgi:modulator of FtsH protease
MGETGWADFFVATMGAAAALTGLVIVAISINLKQILRFKQLPGRAAEALCILAGAMSAAGIALIPHQKLTAFGFEIVCVGAAVCFASIYNQIKAYLILRKLKQMQTSWWLARIPVGFTGMPLLIGGALMVAGADAGAYWIAAGVLISLVVGVQVTWVLLVEILR